MQTENNLNPLFELAYEEDRCEEGSLDQLKDFLNNEGMKLFHMNVCSIRSKHNELTQLFAGMQGEFDCIVLTEAHINTELMNIAQYSFQGYKPYCTQNNVRKTDGIAVYVKSCLEHTVEEIIIKDSNCILIKIKKLNKIYSTLAFYRSPSGKIDTFLVDFEKVVRDSNKQNEIKILTGDINIDLINKKSSKVQKYLNIMCEHGYMPLLNKPTRVKEKRGKISKTCLDHIFAGPQIDDSFKTFILNSSTSDHFSTILNIKINTNSPPNIANYHTISNINENQLINKIQSEMWGEIYNSEDPDFCINKIVNKINEYIKECTVNKVKKSEAIKKSWVTAGILNSIKKRDKLHLICKKQPFNRNAKTVYAKYRNKLNKIILAAKINYYREQINHAEGNKRKIWSTINEISRYKKEKSGDIKKIEIEGTIVEVEKESLKVANHFNDFYSRVGISNSVNTESTETHNLEENREQSQSYLYFSRIKEKEIENIITGLKGGTAPGHDGIKISTLKVVKKYIVKPLCHTFNLCLKKGIFPAQFKQAIICPVYKGKGPAHMTTNYRPISLLTSFTKVFERCVKARLVKFIEENDILSPSQFGFRQGKSTSDAIVEVIDSVYPAIDKKVKSAVILMDLSRAFDLVSHDTLLKKMEKIGIREIPLKFFQSYLNGRVQQVKIHSFKTETIQKPSHKYNNQRQLVEKMRTKIEVLSEKITNHPYSVPQGTVLSPTLYNLYVSELGELELHGKLVSFADDTALIVTGNTWNQVFDRIQLDMCKVKQWFKKHNLSLNMNKTKILPFTNDKRTLPNNNSIKIHEQDCETPCNCEEIEVVSHWKYLGVELDCHLRWDYHIETLTKRMRRYIYPFLSLRQILNISLLKQVYHALVQSILEYGVCAYGRADPTILGKLCTVQNLILKILYKKDRRYSTEKLYDELKVLDVKYLFIKNICSHVHKNKSTFIKYTTNQYSLRQKNLIMPKQNTKKGQKNIHFLGLQLYENLSPKLKHIEDTKKFKRELKLFLLNHKPNIEVSKYI